MMKKNTIKQSLISLFIIGSLCCFTTLFAAKSCHKPRTKVTVITLQSAYPKHLTHLGDLPYQFAHLVEKLSGNSIKVIVHEPEKAVSHGTIDAAFSGLSYKITNNPALELFTAVPFGPSPIEYAGWMYCGGGIKLLNDYLKNENIVIFPSILLPAEASGSFKKEINHSSDLKGLKIRAYGLTRKIFDALGAKTVMLPGHALHQALKENKIDATEYSNPSSDLGLKLYEVTNYYYVPDWHQPATLLYIYINKNKWKQLTLQQQTIIQTACEHLVFHTYIKLQDVQQQALNQLKTKTHIKTWSPEMLKVFQKTWQKISTEISAKNADFKKVLNSINTYRKQHRVWDDMHQI